MREPKDGQVAKLRRRIARLEKENDRLKSELATLEQFRKITSRYIDNKLDGVPVEDVIKGVEKSKKLHKIQEESEERCIKCGSDLTRKVFPNIIVKWCNNNLCNHRESEKRGSGEKKSTEGND